VIRCFFGVDCGKASAPARLKKTRTNIELARIGKFGEFIRLIPLGSLTL
jgi:hypothetical protein